MSSLRDYAERYEGIRFERRDGVLQITLHTAGESFAFNARTHHDLGFAFADVADDPENRVVILTGTGDRFCADFDYGSFAEHIDAGPHEAWLKIRADGRRMLQVFRDIEVPVTHFVAGLPPADGMQVVWTTLLGLNRGRYFLLTGETIDAAQALGLGVVGEVLPAVRLLARAWELAGQWAQCSRPHRPASACTHHRHGVVHRLARQGVLGGRRVRRWRRTAVVPGGPIRGLRPRRPQA
jgi:enoyl-CoA hydratase/carnithine racemase